MLCAHRGYSPKAFEFDRAFVTSTGAFEGLQTINNCWYQSEIAPVEEFVLRFREAGLQIMHMIYFTYRT